LEVWAYTETLGYYRVPDPPRKPFFPRYAGERRMNFGAIG
jgi:hypothetical protein